MPGYLALHRVVLVPEVFPACTCGLYRVQLTATQTCDHLLNSIALQRLQLRSCIGARVLVQPARLSLHR